MIDKMIPLSAAGPGWLMKAAQKRLDEGREAEALTLARLALSRDTEEQHVLPEYCAMLRRIGCTEAAERQILQALPDAEPSLISPLLLELALCQTRLSRPDVLSSLQMLLMDDPWSLQAEAARQMMPWTPQPVYQSRRLPVLLRRVMKHSENREKCMKRFQRARKMPGCAETALYTQALTLVPERDAVRIMQIAAELNRLSPGSFRARVLVPLAFSLQEKYRISNPLYHQLFPMVENAAQERELLLLLQMTGQQDVMYAYGLYRIHSQPCCVRAMHLCASLVRDDGAYDLARSWWKRILLVMPKDLAAREQLQATDRMLAMPLADGGLPVACVQHLLQRMIKVLSEQGWEKLMTDERELLDWVLVNTRGKLPYQLMKGMEACAATPAAQAYFRWLLVMPDLPQPLRLRAEHVVSTMPHECYDTDYVYRNGKLTEEELPPYHKSRHRGGRACVMAGLQMCAGLDGAGNLLKLAIELWNHASAYSRRTLAQRPQEFGEAMRLIWLQSHGRLTERDWQAQLFPFRRIERWMNTMKPLEGDENSEVY